MGKFHCRDHWFRLRQFVDARYYMHWMYADADSYTASAYKHAFRDLLRCRRIGKLPAGERPAEYRRWFSEENEGSSFNDVWSYREQPKMLGRWGNCNKG